MSQDLIASTEVEGQAPSGVTDADINIAEHARRIRELLGVTADDPERERRIGIHNAQRDGSHCAQCRQAIGAGDPIWRKSLSMGPGFFGGWRYTIAPCCRRCTPHQEGFVGPEPCEGCGRPVYTNDDRRVRLRILCSDKCKQQVQAHRGA